MILTELVIIPTESLRIISREFDITDSFAVFFLRLAYMVNNQLKFFTILEELNETANLSYYRFVTNLLP